MRRRHGHLRPIARPLPHGGKEFGAGRVGPMPGRQAQPIEPRLGQDQGVALSLIELAEPRFDVAADFQELQVGS